MITGVVTSFHQATIRLIVRGPTGQAQEIEAVIDTGFDGAIFCLQPILPPRVCHGVAVDVRYWPMAPPVCLTSMKQLSLGMALHAVSPWTLRTSTPLSGCASSTAMN